ncbi:hypothetical protein NDN16_16280 [Aureimonas altamirensis]|uniref:hypothetical protein n=1 Tax=Aureimonas altamirensis TaxID=370622 RepID=UPI0020373110|nr:hypothetical protein [Aureimonas altamirensis]MCM2505229.1 hypothetical protein [Aureimonas altamirensis]
MSYALRILMVIAFSLAATLASRAGLVMAGGCPSQQEVQRSCPVEPAAALPIQSKADAKCGIAVLGSTQGSAARSADGAWLPAHEAGLLEGQPPARDDPPPRTRHS